MLHAVGQFLTLIVAFAAMHATDPLPLMPRARQVKELNSAAYELMDVLKANPVKCPSKITKDAGLAVMFCGSTPESLTQHDLTKQIDSYLFEERLARVFVHDDGWDRSRHYLRRSYLIAGVHLTAHVGRRRDVVVLEYETQCMASTLPPPTVARERFSPPGVRKKVTGPRYPEEAREAGVEGSVMLQVMVRTDGAAGEVCLVYESQWGWGFQAEAVKAVKSWRFKPATLEGMPVAVPFRFRVDFRMR